VLGPTWVRTKKDSNSFRKALNLTSSLHENLLKRFDQQAQQLREEFTSKLDAESRRVISLVNEVQNDATSESAVKKQLQSIAQS
jgi:hypothetical protein